MAEQTSFAMGTYVRISLQGKQADAAIKASLAELERLENVFDRFKPHTELSKVNARAGAGWTPISTDLAMVLSLTLDIAARTNGAFDPTVGPLVDLWGFREQNGGIPDHAPPAQAEIRQALLRVGYHKVELDDQHKRVRLAPGVVIDLGGVAKGYALDRLGDIAKQYDIRNGLIDLGGNIRVLGEKAPNTPWRIAVRHPRNPEAVFAVVPVHDRNVATSGDYQRYFTWKGKRYAHILDPRTGQPAQEVISVTIFAPTGALSDVLSTAAYVLGSEKGKAVLESIAKVDGVFLDKRLHMTVTRGLTNVERVR